MAAASPEETQGSTNLRKVDPELIKGNVAFPYDLVNKDSGVVVSANKVIGSKDLEAIKEAGELFYPLPAEQVSLQEKEVKEISFADIRHGAVYSFDLLDAEGHVLLKAEQKVSHNFVYGYKHLESVRFIPNFEKVELDKVVLWEVAYDDIKPGKSYAFDMVTEEGYLIFPRHRSIADVRYIGYHFFKKFFLPLPNQLLQDDPDQIYKISASLFMQDTPLLHDLVNEKGNLLLARIKSLTAEDIQLLRLLKQVYIVLPRVTVMDTSYPDQAKELFEEWIRDASNEAIASLYVLREAGMNLTNEIAKLFSTGTHELMVALQKCCLKHYKHSLNLALLSLGMIVNMKTELGFQYNDDKEFNRKAANFFLGALLHDIGLIKLPKELMEKSMDTYEKEDKLLFSSHPQKGYEVLQRFDRMKNSSDQNASAASYHDITKQCVLFHHERYDDKGYPTRLPYEGLPLAAKWVGVLEIFDVLMSNSRRGERDLNKVADSLKGLVNACGTLLDLTMVSQFILKVGNKLMHGIPFYKAGDFVVLDSGDLSTVVTPSLSFPLAPIVQVLYSNKGKKVTRQSIVDLRKDTRMIEKFLAPNRVDEYIKRAEKQGYL